MSRPITVTTNHEPRGYVVALLLAAGVAALICAYLLTVTTGLAHFNVWVALAWVVMFVLWLAGRSDRVELYPDNVVKWQNLRRQTFRLDDVVGVTVRTIVRPPIEDEPERVVVSLSVKLKGGDPLDFVGEANAAWLWHAALVDALVLRLSRRMEGGKTLRFSDCEGRKVAVSARGIRLRREATADDGVGYREAYRDPASWLPWGEITSVVQDGQRITIQFGARAETTSFTPFLDDLHVLNRLLLAWVERGRPEASQPSV